MNGYPTQYAKVGSVKCFFFSCYKGGRTPLFNIGPSWPFMLGLIIFAVTASLYFTFMISMLTKISPNLRYAGYFLVGLDDLVMLWGMLKNPGIPQALFDNFLKNQIGKSEGYEIVDMENPSANGGEEKPKKQKLRYGDHYCTDCGIWRDETTVHCFECNVCIEGYDHHCVFFGKCIGGGNIYQFGGTLALVIIVFLFFAFLTIYDVIVLGGGKGKK